jgi:hypothetical protein
MQPDPSIPYDPTASLPSPGSVPPPKSAPSPIPPKTASLPSTPPAPTSTSRGQRSGIIQWSGTLEKEGMVVIEGNHSSAGTITGELPGVPVLIDVDTREFGVAEAPSPSNGWKRIVIRSRKKQHTVVTIKWTALP